MSCADVCLDMDYDGDNEFYAEVIRTARQPHACCECGRTILEDEIFPAWLKTSAIDCLAKIDSLAARDKLRDAFNEWRKDGAA